MVQQFDYSAGVGSSTLVCLAHHQHLPTIGGEYSRLFHLPIARLNPQILTEQLHSVTVAFAIVPRYSEDAQQAVQQPFGPAALPDPAATMARANAAR